MVSYKILQYIFHTWTLTTFACHRTHVTWLLGPMCVSEVKSRQFFWLKVLVFAWGKSGASLLSTCIRLLTKVSMNSVCVSFAPQAVRMKLFRTIKSRMWKNSYSHFQVCLLMEDLFAMRSLLPAYPICRFPSVSLLIAEIGFCSWEMLICQHVYIGFAFPLSYVDTVPYGSWLLGHSVEWTVEVFSNWWLYNTTNVI